MNEFAVSAVIRILFGFRFRGKTFRTTVLLSVCGICIGAPGVSTSVLPHDLPMSLRDTWNICVYRRYDHCIEIEKMSRRSFWWRNRLMRTDFRHGLSTIVIIENVLWQSISVRRDRRTLQSVLMNTPTERSVSRFFKIQPSSLYIDVYCNILTTPERLNENDVFHAVTISSKHTRYYNMKVRSERHKIGVWNVAYFCEPAIRTSPSVHVNEAVCYAHELTGGFFVFFIVIWRFIRQIRQTT